MGIFIRQIRLLCCEKGGLCVSEQIAPKIAQIALKLDGDRSRSFVRNDRHYSPSTKVSMKPAREFFFNRNLYSLALLISSHAYGESTSTERPI